MKKNEITIISLISGFLISALCCYIPDNHFGQIITTCTGSLVIVFLIVAYLYVSLLATWLSSFLTRYLFSVGLVMLLIEYVSSIISHINLNGYTSIAWNDVGNLFISGGFIHDLYVFIRQVRKRKNVYRRR